MTIRVLQFGRTGQLARAVLEAAPARKAEILALGRDDVDLGDANAVNEAISSRAGTIDVVLNAAAYTRVDAAESDPETAHAVNAAAPAVMARACNAAGLPLVHVSTDYVFDGAKPGPYLEDDEANPLGVYGRTKLAGEQGVRAALDRHLIVRTSWVYAARGRNFLRAMLRLAEERDEVRVVNDQCGAPTAAADLAQALLTLAAAAARGEAAWGVYHFANAGETTWAGFADAIFERAAPALGRRPRVIPIGTAEYPTPAARPVNSVLDCSKITRVFDVAPRPWREALEPTLAHALDDLVREGS